MRTINRAEAWDKVYDAFQQINFAAWDYNTIKQSLIDYIKLYRPEDFSDFIESSEFITILEIFAYVGELLAYRIDVNANENFISTARRKESVLRLARLLSYNASRNINARGLVKITSISTTERTFDLMGNDLTNRTIYWDDQNNSNWKEQFLIVMNKCLDQKYGSVLPSDRVQVNDVLFELYQTKSSASNGEVISFSVSASGNGYPMEIVPVELDEEDGPFEKRPERFQKMNLMYLSDGLGDSSENTGFFFFTKQGTLEKFTKSFDGVTPNQFFDVNVHDCNEADIWVNNIDSETHKIITDVGNGRIGAWEKVDIANSQNVLFNTNPYKNKYEVQTLDNDGFRIIFGDGNFSAIPSGLFEIWYRVSANDDIVIPTSSIQNLQIPLSYINGIGKEDTVTFSISLMSPIQNATSSEDIEQIRRIAPAVYYTQDRMVNGRDYNEFMLQDNSILKLKAINRTFAGDSKYIYWHDPKEHYENVKIFGDDLVLYYKTVDNITRMVGDMLPQADGGANIRLIDAVFNNYLEPILSSESYFTKSILTGISPIFIRKEFNNQEAQNIKMNLRVLINSAPDSMYIKFDPETNTFSTHMDDHSDWDFSINLTVDGNWTITYKGTKVVVHSDSTKFWNHNNDEKIITYDTMNSNYDTIVLLKANIGANNLVLSRHYDFRILRQEYIDSGENSGSYSIHDLEVMPDDPNMDGIPDEVDLAYLINRETDFVYFRREGLNSPWNFVPYSEQVLLNYQTDIELGTSLWKREIGKEGLNFAWFHRTPRYHLIDPSPSNLIDVYVMQRGYYTLFRQWLNGDLTDKPKPESSYQLRNTYAKLLDSKMISDSIILHSGSIKLIIGNKSQDNLQARLKVIKSKNSTSTNNQIKAKIVELVSEFFDINLWEFGETFYFSELAAHIHGSIPEDIDSIVFVPINSNQSYGDLQQIYANEDEIIQAHITVNDVEIIESLNPKILKQTV